MRISSRPRRRMLTNLTPLVDVGLVLVIIFMVTAPLFEQPSLDVKLPKATTEEGKEQENVTVTITADGRMAAKLGWMKHFYRNENDEALRLLRDGLASRPDPLSYFAVAQILELEGRPVGALEACLEICRRYPDDPMSQLEAMGFSFNGQSPAVQPEPEEQAGPNRPARCQAVTKAGAQCKNRAVAGRRTK